MTDSYSSDEEIIKRRRFIKQSVKKKDLRSLFDEEDSIEEPHFDLEDVGERSTIFNEIFGTGKEYLYVLEAPKESDEEDSEEKDQETVYSPTDCKRFVVMNLDVENKNLERFVDLLLKGYVLNYVLLHDIDYEMDIYTGMKVEDAVKEFKAFTEYKKRFKSDYLEDVYSWDALKYIPKYEEARRGYKSYGMNKFLLTVEQFEANLKDREVVFLPCNYTGEEVDFDEEEYVHQLTTSIIVRDSFMQLFKIYGNFEEEKIFEKLCKFFLFSGDEYNEKRKEILRRVMEGLKTDRKEEEDKREDQKKDLFNKIVDRIFNGSLKRLTEEEKVVSVTKENNTMKGVVLSNRGEVQEKFKMSKNELEVFLDEVKPYCVLLSGFSPSIRLAMQNLIGRNCLYVENCWYKSLRGDKYEFCTRIGRLALCPELEYIRLFKKGELFSKKVLSEILGYDVIQISTEEIQEVVKRAILTTVSITGLDLNLVLSQPDKTDVISFLGLDSVSKMFTVESYGSLREVQEYLPSKKDFVNLMTYLRMFKEYSQVSDPLDETPVHPENYFILEEEDGDQFIKGVQREDEVTDLRITKRDVKRIKESVRNDYRPEFSGFPDSVAFQNLSGSTPGIIGSVLEGRVFFVEEGYVLVSVLNNVTVFCRTQDSHFANQLVKVKILEANEAFVSFNGELVADESRRKKYPRFCKHPLYKELDSKQAEDFLREKNELILLRRSTRDNDPILVFQFFPGIFVHFKLESSASSFSFRGKSYESIDGVITHLVKGVLRKVQEISKHKLFYESEEEAVEKTEGDSNYIKYGFYFPKEYPGKLCFLFNNRGVLNREYLGVYETLSYKGNSFETLSDFLVYRKRQ